MGFENVTSAEYRYCGRNIQSGQLNFYEGVFIKTVDSEVFMIPESSLCDIDIIQ